MPSPTSPAKRRGPGRPRANLSPKKIGPHRIAPELWPRLDRALAALRAEDPKLTQRQFVEDAIEARLASLGY